MGTSFAKKDAPRESARHLGRVELGETKRGLAQLAVFLVGVRQPFHEAILVDKHDAASTLAREVQGLFLVSLGTAYSTSIDVRVCVCGSRAPSERASRVGSRHRNENDGERGSMGRN